MEPEEFIRESNKIEGIYRDPTRQEVDEYNRFLNLHMPDVHDLARFVDVYQPGAKLRSKKGMNVFIGGRHPQPGGPVVPEILNNLLQDIGSLNAYTLHVRYEKLHPFSDCNGRSGRMLWAWKMHHYPPFSFPLGFLHHFYYQALQASIERGK